MRTLAKALKITALISGILTVVYVFIFPLFLKYFNTSTIGGVAAPVGIIGGADGPTAIYLTAKGSGILQYSFFRYSFIFLAIIAIISTVSFFCVRNKE